MFLEFTIPIALTIYAEETAKYIKQATMPFMFDMLLRWFLITCNDNFLFTNRAKVTHTIKLTSNWWIIVNGFDGYFHFIAETLKFSSIFKGF